MGSKWANKFELAPNKWVFVPEIEYRNSGKDIKSVLERTWKAPTYFWHLREKGHIGALKSHLGHDFFINVMCTTFLIVLINLKLLDH